MAHQLLKCRVGTMCPPYMGFVLPSPVHPPCSITNKRRGRRGLSEHVVRVPQPRLFVMEQGNPAGAVNRGSPSFDYLSWRSKTTKLRCRLTFRLVVAKGNQLPGCPRRFSFNIQSNLKWRTEPVNLQINIAALSASSASDPSNLTVDCSANISRLASTMAVLCRCVILIWIFFA